VCAVRRLSRRRGPPASRGLALVPDLAEAADSCTSLLLQENSTGRSLAPGSTRCPSTCSSRQVPANVLAPPQLVRPDRPRRR
jgi:hypothetical protein